MRVYVPHRAHSNGRGPSGILPTSRSLKDDPVRFGRGQEGAEPARGRSRLLRDRVVCAWYEIAPSIPIRATPPHGDDGGLPSPDSAREGSCGQFTLHLTWYAGLPLVS